MQSILAASLLALLAGAALAQPAVPPDPSEPSQRVPVPRHDGALADYRPYVEPEVARWREANAEMGRLGGHAGHVAAPPPARSDGGTSAKSGRPQKEGAK